MRFADRIAAVEDGIRNLFRRGEQSPSRFVCGPGSPGLTDAELTAAAATPEQIYTMELCQAMDATIAPPTAN